MVGTKNKDSWARNGRILRQLLHAATTQAQPADAQLRYSIAG
jgi:hypothetical protein